MSLLDSLNSSDKFDLYAAMNDRSAPTDLIPYRKLSSGIDTLPPLGFTTDDPLFLVYFSDLLFPHFAQVIPDYDFYVLIEYDVGFTIPADAFVDRLIAALRSTEFRDVDLIGCELSRRGDDWHHSKLCARRYSEIWGVFFPFIVLSARAIPTLLQARRDEGPADLPTEDRIFCEAFVPTVLHAAGGYRMLDFTQIFPNVYTRETFYFGLPMLADAPLQRDGKPLATDGEILLHPVYDAPDYLAKHFLDAVANDRVASFLSALDDPSLPIPVDLKTDYAAKARARLGRTEAQSTPARPVATAFPPVVLLAGGLGTRLREETEVRPKPMVEIGGRPMLWHIMKLYASHGFNEFVICLGYKGEIIKSFFLDYHLKSRSLTVDLTTGGVDPHGRQQEDDWRVHLLDTGEATLTGGRVKRAAEFLGNRRFMLTYGDGLSNVNLPELLAYHESHGKLATITAVRPPARFGGLTLEGDYVRSFDEKPQVGEGWINGGFMVLEPGIIDYIDGDATILERDPLERLAENHQLVAFRHDAFWQCMDTVRDLSVLRESWDSGHAPWKNW